MPVDDAQLSKKQPNLFMFGIKADIVGLGFYMCESLCVPLGEF